MAGDIACVPSSGIVTTAKEWCFLRVVMFPRKEVYRSSPLYIMLSSTNTIELAKQVSAVVSKIAGMLELQKKCVDDYLLAKKSKS